MSGRDERRTKGDLDLALSYEFGGRREAGWGGKGVQGEG